MNVSIIEPGNDMIYIYIYIIYYNTTMEIRLYIYILNNIIYI